MVRYRLLGVAVCLAIVACSAAPEAPRSEPEPQTQAEPSPTPAAPTVPTVEEYATASQEACDLFLGGLFTLAQTDDELDTSRQDAAQELFLRRAADIAELYGRYRAQINALEPPASDDARDAHAQIVELMGDNRHTIEAVGEAHARGDVGQATALVGESNRIEEDIAARQEALGIRPCGQ